MVFITTCNNISVISWRSVLLVEEIGEKHRPVASHWQFFLSHNVVLSTPRLRGGFGGSQLHLYTIATTTTPICYVTYRSYGPMYLFLSRFVLWHLDTEKNHCLGYHKNLFKNLNYVSEKYYFRINWSYYKYIIHYLSFMYLCSLDVKHQSINHVFVRFISYCTVVLHFKMYGWRSH
jgi:hypothetical protein